MPTYGTLCPQCAKYFKSLFVFFDLGRSESVSFHTEIRDKCVMKRYGNIAVLVLLVATAGCRRSAETTEIDPSALTRRNFVGKSLTVFLDGRQTQPLGEADPEAWTVKPISGNPTIRFMVDPKAFELPIRRVNISIHPVVDGKTDQTAVYWPTERPAQPDQKVTAKSFEYVSQGRYRKVAKLPPGRYRLFLHVIGQKNQDRQIILFTVE